MGNEGSRLECRGVEWGMREAGWNVGEWSGE